jgi:hypothetical protein
LYGNLPRCWTVEQLLVFLRSVSVREHLNAFLLSFAYGLRASEVGGAFIVPGQRLVGVFNKKCSRMDYLPLLAGTECLLGARRSYHPIVYARWFRDAVRRLPPEFNYLYHGRRMQYTFHTLRRTAGNLLREYTHDVYKEAVFLRHRLGRRFGATAAYMHYPLDSLRCDMQEAFCSVLSEFLLEVRNE